MRRLRHHPPVLKKTFGHLQHVLERAPFLGSDNHPIGLPTGLKPRWEHPKGGARGQLRSLLPTIYNHRERK